MAYLIEAETQYTICKFAKFQNTFWNVVKNSWAKYVISIHLYLLARTEKKYYGIHISWCDIDTSVPFQTIYISPFSCSVFDQFEFFHYFSFLLAFSSFSWYVFFLAFLTSFPFFAISSFSCTYFLHPPWTSQYPCKIFGPFSPWSSSGPTQRFRLLWTPGFPSDQCT